MDITTIDAVSFAIRVGQAAASELYTLLSVDDDYRMPEPGWFNPGRFAVMPADAEAAQHLDDLAAGVDALGQYACLNQVDQGERLFRWGQMKAIVPSGDWAVLDVAGRQAFEAFTLTTRHTYLGLAVAQQAIKNARAAAGVPTTLKREDSIFEETESLGTLRPEAVAASGLTARMEREGAAERQRQEDLAWGALWDEAEAENREWDKEHRPKRQRPPKPAPIAAGETVAKPAVNRGGRGNKKAVPNPA